MSNKDFQNGFALGLASGGVVEVIDTTEIDNLEDLIDNSGVLEDKEGSVEEKVEELIDKAYWENYWYELSGKWTVQYNSLFGYPITKLPRLNFDNASQLKYTFANSGLERIDYYLKTKNIKSFGASFKGASKLKFIYGMDTSNANDVYRMFFECKLLETIQEPLNFQSVSSPPELPFWQCYALKDIKFVAETIKISLSFSDSSLLSAESIQSIIDGLATVETAQTLTLNKSIVLTDEQKATINAKGWTLAQ